MKIAIAALILGLSLTLPTNAYAKKDSPALRAVLFEKGIVAEGRIVMVQNRDGNDVTSFDYSEQGEPIVCIKAPCVNPNSQQIHFVVTSKRRLECGSSKYIARGSSKRGSVRMEVIDHTERQCDDLKPFLWEVSLESRKSHRHFVGNPIPADTDCSKYSEGKMCTMMEMPLRCKAEKYGGEPLMNPIIVDAGNPCFAGIKMDVQACEQGLDPDRFLDGDIRCVYAAPPPVVVIVPPPCPIASCIAPPEGCALVPDPTLDANGCKANPCGNLICQ